MNESVSFSRIRKCIHSLFIYTNCFKSKCNVYLKLKSQMLRLHVIQIDRQID